MTSKSQTADDARTIELARKSPHFIVSIWAGGRFHRYPARTLAHARAGGAMLETRTANGRQSMVYTVDPDGGPGTFVPRHLDGLILNGEN